MTNIDQLIIDTITRSDKPITTSAISELLNVELDNLHVCNVVRNNATLCATTGYIHTGRVIPSYKEQVARDCIENIKKFNLASDELETSVTGYVYAFASKNV